MLFNGNDKPVMFFLRDHLLIHCFHITLITQSLDIIDDNDFL